ncbi:hypothetical protein Hypma_014358 [Hypsizygus marmoreus]|uniref:PIN domain-containing protein n=1 Tax=Hypsizygus marmoreus TaxID=39966 RepID=A0A369JGW9_HYPMA|nr:hypothetical protein Hypma_014358 [Hypsizygus marmoreus]
MSEKKQLGGPTVSPGKLAMSRALGAAFLNHQVEQLEKSVTSVSVSHGNISGNGPASGNWRNRRPNPSVMPPNAKHPPMAPGIKIANRKPGEDSQAARKGRGSAVREVKTVNEQDQATGTRRKSSDEDDGGKEKYADIVIVDASVLVHALYQLKKWCRDGREEVIIVPLEALNTLDLLKKGTSPLAQRARAASRILEAQVGTNPRIRVQQDDAFVLWDKIAFQDILETHNDTETSKTSALVGNAASPEWVRRTICCARWEVENAEKANMPTTNGAAPSGKPRVLLAVLASPPSASAAFDTSPRSAVPKLPSDSSSHSTTPETLTPVPLPAPSLPHPNKYEPRSAGVLVAHWAKRAGVGLIEVEATRSGSDEEFGKRSHVSAGRNRRTSGNVESGSYGPGGPGYGGGGSPYGSSSGGYGAAGKGALVERPPAVMAMMEMVAQPHRKVVRVLARGEKLDPDP